MSNKILAVVGMCGSGKSEITNFLVENGFEKVYFGAITFDEMKKRNMEINEKNERQIREEFRQSGDMGIYAKLNEQKIIDAYKIGNVVVESLYSWSEYKYLKEKFGDYFKVISVVTNSSIRKERLAIRDYRPMMASEVDSRDYAEIENLEKGGPIAIADYFIINNGNKEELLNQCRDILNNC